MTIQASRQQKEVQEKLLTDENKLLFKKHFFTADLPDNLKSNLGKYYTPPHLVNLIKKLVSPYVRTNSIIMDLAAGCGAFLDCFPAFLNSSCLLLSISAFLADVDCSSNAFSSDCF